ncbi:MAG: HD domain-containing phosphohydrolase [Sphaerochaetaceae bacterium]|jgi:diguanylate cyclase (GGDEF)-like protein
MIIDLLYNIAILLSLSVVYVVIPSKAKRKNLLIQLAQGIFFALGGILIMSRPVIITAGLVLDGRTLLAGVSGMFFGFVPTTVAVISMAIFRYTSGGVGMITGILSPITSAAIGLLWRALRYKKVTEKGEIGFEPLFVGLIIHIIFVFEFLFVQSPNRVEIVKLLALPILLTYPISFHLLALLIFNQERRLDSQEKIKLSEQRFKTIFDKSPLGIFLAYDDGGKLIQVNEQLKKLLAIENFEEGKIGWNDFVKGKPILNGEEFIRINKLRDSKIKRLDGKDIWVKTAATNIQSEDQQTKLVLGMVTDITERKELEFALKYANSHDGLTNIHNRSEFEKLLKAYDEKGNYPLAVVMGDVNGLKVINDAFGRETGDNLLINIAETLKEVTQNRGVCARISGDQFALILQGVDETKGWKIIEEISEKGDFVINGVEVTLSFGVAVKRSSLEDIDEIVKLAENSMIRSKLSESPSARSKTVNAIINTLHEKSHREELHSRRVSELAIRLGESYGLNQKELGELKTVGLLHDIGKIAVDKSILEKKGELSEEEWESIRRHPETGWRILGTVGELGELSNAVLYHHEKVDGSGYPHGIKGDDIPLYARIIAIADAYDAMTAARSYRLQVNEKEAASEIKKYSGSQFDEKLARLFVEKVLHFSWGDL